MHKKNKKSTNLSSVYSYTKALVTNVFTSKDPLCYFFTDLVLSNILSVHQVAFIK